VLPGLAGLARALPWLMAMSPAAVEPIVLVDDDAEMRAMLRDFLAGAGFRVVEAGDTEALLDLVPRVSPAAIILDHELPGDWGLEVLPLLRQRHPEVPVIVITAFGGPRLQATAERLGAAGYLDKPFRMARLLSLLEHVRAPA
jgi:DNA-binding response OmpR family regulator